MSVNVFPLPSAGGTSGPEFNTYSAATARQWYSTSKAFSAGTYSFRVLTAGSYTLVFYNGAVIIGSVGPFSANTTFTLPAPADVVRYFSSVNSGSFELSNQASSSNWTANMTINTITSSQTVTLPNGGIVVALGGGAGGSVDSFSGGSGYLATGILPAGSYSAVIGSGGNASTGQGGPGGTTSIGGITAAGGGTAGSPWNGGTSGVVSSGSIGFVDGQGPFGSGTRISESFLGNSISWATTGAGVGIGGGVYGGGGPSTASGSAANGFGGGGSSATNTNNNVPRSAGGGFQGVIWIGTIN